MSLPETVISVENLTKYYGSVLGAGDVSFSVRRGEIFGFLGPNGAGKTTCIRLILDLLRPDTGRILLFGAPVCGKAWRLRKEIGNLPGETAWWPSLTGREILDFFSRIRSSGSLRLRDTLLDRLNLDGDLLNRKVRTYSRGTRRKLGLTAAMQHAPNLLILDEPTSGLDPLVRRAFFSICRRLKEEGKTIFLSSHNLSETQEICDRVGIIRSGRLVAVEEIADLRNKSTRKVKALVDGNIDPAKYSLPGVDVVESRAGRIVLTCEGDLPPLLRILSQEPLKDIEISSTSLEEFFMRHYSEPGNK